VRPLFISWRTELRFLKHEEGMILFFYVRKEVSIISLKNGCHIRYLLEMTMWRMLSWPGGTGQVEQLVAECSLSNRKPCSGQNVFGAHTCPKPVLFKKNVKPLIRHRRTCFWCNLYANNTCIDPCDLCSGRLFINTGVGQDDTMRAYNRVVFIQSI
jgi:hypothetical protein